MNGFRVLCLVSCFIAILLVGCIQIPKVPEPEKAPRENNLTQPSASSSISELSQNDSILNTTANVTELNQTSDGCIRLDSSWPYQPLHPTLGQRNILVILWDPHRPGHPAPSKAAMENIIFGSNESVNDYFQNNSRNRFELKNVGVLGWYDADKPAEHYWAPSDPNDLDQDGWTSGHVEKWAEAIRKADKEFDFSAYDSNHDGILSDDELGILIVIPQNSPFGTNRPAEGRQYPYSEPLIVDGVRINMIAEDYAGDPPHLGIAAHELSHLYQDTPDMYFNFFMPYAAGTYSLMDNHWGVPDLDPYNKVRLGWIEPKPIQKSGCYILSDIESGGDVLGFYDQKRGRSEFFLIENREISEKYDSGLFDSGIGIWHIIESPDIYRSLKAPKDVNETAWNSIVSYDWGRRGIRMIRPYNEKFDDSRALWDGTDLANGPLRLNWSDGSFSGFSITNISDSGKEMRIWVEVG